MRYILGGNDEYYTSDEVAKSLVYTLLKDLPESESRIFFEPAAGHGAFLKPLWKSNLCGFGIDINPQHPEVIELDFLKDDIPTIFAHYLEKKDIEIIAVGNPPFGFAGNNAIKFFNGCAAFSDYICFIVPKTFKKLSVQNKLDNRFHLYKEYSIPKKSFILNGEKHHVPCIFQIWKKGTDLRKQVVGDLCNFLKQVDKNNADFAMRRVGSKAGKILDGFDYSPSSTYFFKVIKDGTLEKLRNADFSEISNNTVGVKSISQLEIYQYLESLEN